MTLALIVITVVVARLAGDGEAVVTRVEIDVVVGAAAIVIRHVLEIVLLYGGLLAAAALWIHERKNPPDRAALTRARPPPLQVLARAAAP